MLTDTDIAELTEIRRELHRYPDLSGDEAATAARIEAYLTALAPDLIATGIGGAGIVARFDGAAPGPAVMFRAELDGLPITEAAGKAYRSQNEGRGHLCGHDGHMTVLLGLGRLVARRRPERGSVMLLFQPAEENGAGAASMLADPGFARVKPDLAFALHNMPGTPRGSALLRGGLVNCASVGMRVRLIGATSHASEPEKARSPAAAIARLIPELTALAGGAPEEDDFRLVTLTHLRMGAPAFGITPGEGELWATLRTGSDGAMAGLRAAAARAVKDAASDSALEVQIDWHDDFAASVNHPIAAEHLARAAAQTGITVSSGGLPMRGSEDFGRFGAVAPAAMIFLGAGEDHPPLHAADYDFPDDLIAQGAHLFAAIARDLTGACGDAGE
ncbi:MAG: amidohydrolase [Paracoccus sp. (in: a-proteobacteria)]|nr:amidohydrolase [Paracoccus sp. (in: a-proteobacteria)]